MATGIRTTRAFAASITVPNDETPSGFATPG